MEVSLRPAAAADEEFLRRVFAGSRDDLDLLPWDEATKRQFADAQYQAQLADYTKRFPDAELSVVVVDGEDHGRIWVNRAADEIRLLDIAILPEHRSRGTGKVLLERLIAEARAAGLPLRHAVFRDNEDGLRFYERLGFVVAEDAGTYVFMEWRPDVG